MKKITLRQSIIIFGVLIITSAFLSAFGYSQMETHAIKRANQTITSAIKQKADQLKSGPIALLDNFAKSISEKTISSDEQILKDIQSIKNIGNMYAVAYVSAEGKLVDSFGASSSAIDSDFFKSTMQGERFVGKAASESLFEDNILITSPIKSSDKVLGFIMGVYSQESFAKFLQTDIYGNTASMAIINPNGSMVAKIGSSTSNLLQYNTIDEFFADYSLNTSSKDSITSNIKNSTLGSAVVSIGNAKQYMVYLASETSGGILSFVDYSVIQKDARESAFTLTMIISLLCIISMIAVFITTAKGCARLAELESNNDQLKTLEKEYKVAADHNNQMMFKFYPESGCVQLSEELSAIQGLPRIIKNSPELSIESGLVDSESAQAYLKFFKSIHNRVPSSKCAIKCNFSTGTTWYDMDYTLLKGANGESYAVISASDITDRKNAEMEILKRSMEDSLTGALNRKAFEQKAIEIIKKHQGKKHGIVMLDLDSFKTINDTFGHIMGDHVLFETCNQLRGALNDGDLLGRLGGDEFMMLLKDLQTEEIAVNARLQALVDVSRVDFKPGNRSSASLGMSIYPKDGKTFDELYRTADLAVYHAKKEGRNKFVIYNKDLEK